MMTYRLLSAEEWPRLAELIPQEFLPSPEGASAAVAEDEDGNLYGVLFLQLTLHMEPLVLSSPEVRFDRLYDVLYDSVRNQKGLRFYAFADREVVGKMAEHVGMTQTPFKVFEGEVK